MNSQTSFRPYNPIFCAIDTSDLAKARALAEQLQGVVGGLKLGLEFFTAHGPQGVWRLAESGLPIFLDLKLNDIPNTVKGAIKSLAKLPISWLTIHANGGRDMMLAAREAASEAADLKLLAVTVLTSFSAGDLFELGLREGVEAQVVRLALLAQQCGMHGIVCSPQEIAPIRNHAGKTLALVTPGIRAEKTSGDDQKRTLTAKEALELGADYLVVGRPITQAKDPAEAARAMLEV